MNSWLIASLWVGLALVATMVSIRLGLSVALVEIGVGVLAGNFLQLSPNDWVNLVILSAVIPTIIAERFFRPEIAPARSSAPGSAPAIEAVQSEA